MDLRAAHIMRAIIIFITCYIHASQSQSSTAQNNGDISTTPSIPDFTTSLLPSGCHIATDQHLSCFKVEQFPRLSPKTASQITSIVIKDCSVDLGTLDETHFSEYTNLQILTITKCGLSHVHPTTFINNQKLKNIDFSNNKLETISYAVVLSIRRPESINLMNNSFVCNCSMVWIGILSRIKDFDLNITGFPTCGPPDDLKSLKSLILPDCVPPQTQITSSTRTLNLTPGDELILSCTAPAQPPARINWVTEGIASDFELINEGTQNVTLKIANISAEDNGYFNCFGNNSVIRKSAKVEVQINLPARIKDLRLFEDGDCLRYLISGTPPYNITWQHNGDLIQNGFWNDQICTRGVCKEYHTQSGCMTWSAGRRTGLYRLSVHNEFGADERRVQIGIHGNYSLLPVPPGSSFTVRAATSNPVTRRPNPVEDKPDDNEKSVYMQIIAPVVGCLLVLAIIIIACYVKNRKKFYSKSKVLGLDGNRLELSPLSEMPDMMENPNYQLLSKRTTQKLRIINIDQLIFIKELGEGAFGRVYLGSCINLFTGDERTMVAIKTLKSTVTEDAIKNFEYEAELMAEITHENIVSLYGISYNGEHLMMIFEYMENRDLNNYLRCNGPDALSLGYQTWNSSPLLISDLLFIAKQIAAGMSYLTLRHFVHRDLATRNCLVGEKLIVKIGDFGMSRDIYSSDYYKVGGQTMLPIRWMPPESVLYRKFSVESDVWSFGVVLWEIFSYGRQPWFELSNMEVIEHIKDGQLLSKPDECTEEIYELMLSCWSRQPTDRASMSELHDVLCGFLSPQSPYNNNSRALLNKENSFIPSI